MKKLLALLLTGALCLTACGADPKEEKTEGEKPKKRKKPKRKKYIFQNGRFFSFSAVIISANDLYIKIPP